MKFFVAGHLGMVGGAITRALRARGEHVVTRPRAELDLTDRAAVRDFLRSECPDTVVLAAARVGGIHANQTQPADFLHDNLMIAANVIHESRLAGVGRLLNLGSSCIYPRAAPQPIPEEALMTGPLEPTNDAYAIAKIAGIRLCESCNRQYGTDFRSIMPTNLYGPGDNFHDQNGHVLPALIRRFHQAAADGLPSVTVWGTGRALREFLHVDDLARAALFVLDLPKADYDAATGPRQGFLNVGSGAEVTIADLAARIARAAGFAGDILFDPSRPDGTPRKRLDIARMSRLGWQARIPLDQGIRDTCAWFRDHADSLRR